MASKYQSSVNIPVLVNSKIPKLSSLKQQKNNPNTKKLFTRKPLNNSQNGFRIMSSRLKTQQDEPNYPENPDSCNNSIRNLLNQSNSIKFVSTKSSQSLEKLFACSSAQQLPTISQSKPKKQVSDQEKVNKINSKNNKLSQSPIFKEYFELKSSRLDIIYDLEKDDYDTKELLGSTELSSNENICNQDSNEDDYKNHQLQRSKSNQTFSFYYPKDNKSIHKECPSCLINSQKIKELNDINKKLQESILEKQLEIRKLNEKNQKLSRTLKQNETFKVNLEYENKILKEKESFIISQKDEIESAFKKLQASNAKLSQEMKYKDLELNIHKIYKTKSHEMEMKVETLKNELNRAKKSMTKHMTSKSTESLFGKNSKPDLRVVGDFKRQVSQKRLKQPKIARVYSEDTIFSLSSEECD